MALPVTLISWFCDEDSQWFEYLRWSSTRLDEQFANVTRVTFGCDDASRGFAINARNLESIKP
jgi:hypothetical protein